LAGRSEEHDTFKALLKQKPIMKNAIVTGLRGIGKTVLLDSLRSTAIAEGWLWVGTDWSEGASVSEETLATRVLADIALQTSTRVVGEDSQMALVQSASSSSHSTSTLLFVGTSKPPDCLRTNSKQSLNLYGR
jgi:hypothetical protein